MSNKRKDVCENSQSKGASLIHPNLFNMHGKQTLTGWNIIQKIKQCQQGTDCPMLSGRLDTSLY